MNAATLFGLLMLFGAIPLLVSASRDRLRLKAGRDFRIARTSNQSGVAPTQFLSLFSPSEIAALEAPRLKWIARSLPDPRDSVVSTDHARIYWRMAVRKHESSQMLSECILVLASAAFGVSVAGLWGVIAALGFQISADVYPYLAANLALLYITLFAIGNKIAGGRRWMEAIDLYRRIGWPAPVDVRRTSQLHRLLGNVRRGRDRLVAVAQGRGSDSRDS